MKSSLVLVLLCLATTNGSCQQSSKRGVTLKPDSGNFAQGTYRNDFFGFSYKLPKEWVKSGVSPSPLPPGAYYLFIGDLDTGQSLVDRISLVADPTSSNRPGLSTKEYLSAFIRAEVSQVHAEVTRQPSSYSSGGNDFLRADYKWVNDGTTIYSSMVCAKRNGYWLDWTFTTPSQRDLERATDTLQNIAFDHPPSRP